MLRERLLLKSSSETKRCGTEKRERDHILDQGHPRCIGVTSHESDAATLSEIDQGKIDDQLKGNTLKVYMLLLKAPSASVGIREVQRALKFSSPTLAQYHLDKLRELGLVRKESAEYLLVSDVKVGVLRQFYRLGTVLVPRFVLYAVLFTVLLGFLAFIITEVTLVSVFALLLALLGAAIFWYEAARALRERPKG
jgi:DNA-binding transcriptional ArsR family regulator